MMEKEEKQRSAEDLVEQYKKNEAAYEMLEKLRGRSLKYCKMKGIEPLYSHRGMKCQMPGGSLIIFSEPVFAPPILYGTIETLRNPTCKYIGGNIVMFLYDTLGKEIEKLERGEKEETTPMNR